MLVEEHDLDDLDDPAWQDVRQPDGRRLRHEREAARTGPADRDDRDRCAARAGHEALVAAGGSAKVAIVTLLAGVDVDAARSRLAAANGNIRLALEP
jgi:hypothetical protein